ncbi:related to clp1, essential for A-regulated sexual development [Sporisorium reilianum f. sp. reilianum]|uniref:Related to clp1, essential for A-regulated sexual development n=1 Tax=Sporisorium reilianum f. sp. reilianum TaxID=72559 RepID=A0A2N8UMT0_9BASI|nr:related to clp1, essential for A-regulated sexual development [Sporisorium reilianum f. sp. reilianum]
MLMSPTPKQAPLAGRHPTSAQSSSSIRSVPGPSKPVSSRICAVDLAVRQLGSLRNEAIDGKSTFPTSSVRPLQTVDTNVGKSSRQQTPTVRSTVSSPSPKLGAKHPPTSPRKVRSPSNRDIAAGARSVSKATKIGSLLGHSASVTLKGERISVKVPQKLPTPRLKPNSSPYEDLVAHLSRHHFFAEAQQVEQHAVTPDYYLTQYLETARLGKCSLYHQTETFLNANRDYLLSCIVPGEPLPETIPLDVTEWISTLQRPPTHLLAVHSDSEAATLYAVHGQVLALQCVSIPFLPASNETQQHGKVIRHTPTLPLRVPSVRHFNTIMRWLYSQSTTSLLHELLPLKHIVTYLTQRSLAQRSSSSSSSNTASTAFASKPSCTQPSQDTPNLSSADIVEAMSTLSTRHFLDCLQAIQAVWKNGVALGIVSWNFWSTLDQAWNLLIGAMVVSSKRKVRTTATAAATATANELTAQLQSTKLE